MLNFKKLFAMLFFAVATQLFSQIIYKIKLTNEKSAEGFKIFADNDEYSPVSVSFDFKLDNMRSSVKNNQVVVIPARSKHVHIATLRRVLPNKSISFQYRSQINIGNVTQTTFDDTYVYALPFEKGKSYLVFQGYDGPFSHQGQKALDFNLKNGEKIYAARDGVVVGINEESNTRCTTKECAKYNNFVRIMHPDGTFGEYAHLKQNGVEVNLGDKIQRGQFLGYSGDTGWATGPHLHFSVYINRLDGSRDYITTRFQTAAPQPEIAVAGKTYTNK